MRTTRIILVKHALPVLDPGVPARDWRLSTQGEEEAVRLASALRRFLPFRLVGSPEPKAHRTSAIVGEVLDRVPETVDGLREIDRRALPIMSPEEHERFNRRLFVEPDRRVVGRESAREARGRFATALLNAARASGAEHLVAVSHGTVIALFVADYNREVEAFDLWRRMKCCLFVVLQNPSMEMLEMVEPTPLRRQGDDPGVRGSNGR